MRKFLCLCSVCLLTYTFPAQARVQFITNDSSITFKSTKSVSCPKGYRNYSGQCVLICNKANYPLSYKPDAKKGTFEVCTGIPPRYRYTECFDGYEMNNQGDCAPRDCSGYPLGENEINRNIGHVESCKSADTVTYKYTSCNDSGWVLDGVYCVARYCSPAEYPYDMSASAPNSKVGPYETCQSGDNVYWGYTGCIQPDWILEGGQCWNQCTGYTSIVDTIPNCTTTEYCVSKAGTLYRCIGCQSGYTLSSNTCIVECTWSGYTLTSCPTHGTCNSYSCGGVTKYALTGCQAGYTLTAGSCVLNKPDPGDDCVPPFYGCKCRTTSINCTYNNRFASRVPWEGRGHRSCDNGDEYNFGPLTFATESACEAEVGNEYDCRCVRHPVTPVVPDPKPVNPVVPDPKPDEPVVPKMFCNRKPGIGTCISTSGCPEGKTCTECTDSKGTVWSYPGCGAKPVEPVVPIVPPQVELNCDGYDLEEVFANCTDYDTCTKNGKTWYRCNKWTEEEKDTKVEDPKKTPDVVPSRGQDEIVEKPDNDWGLDRDEQRRIKSKSDIDYEVVEPDL